MAETRVPLSMSKWTLLGVSPLSYEIGYAATGGYLPVAIAVAASLPDPTETNFRTLPQGKEFSGGVDYASGKNVYARALTSLPTTVIVSKE